MQKVLINALQLSNTNSGVQYYTLNLLNNIKSDSPPSPNSPEIKALLSNSYKNTNIDNSIIQQVNFNSQNRFKRVYFENFALANYFKKNQFNLYHSTSYVLPISWKYTSVLTVHDLIALDYPEFCHTKNRTYFKFYLPLSIKKATKIIAVSNTIKKDIIKHFNIPDNKIEVIYHGISKRFKKVTESKVLNKVQEKYRLPEKFILFVGNIEPKKNLVRLLMAYNQLKKNNNIEHKLVIIGKKAWKYKSVFKTLKVLKLDNDTFFPGYIPENDLPVFYSLADLFVFPSLYEGFGSPPLEAMACETAVLVSNTGALPEITGGKCLQVDPYSVDDLANGMNLLIHDVKLRQETIEKGKKWVNQFTWEKTTKSTIKIYNELLSN